MYSFLISCCLASALLTQSPRLSVQQPSGKTIDKEIQIQVEELEPFQEIRIRVEALDQNENLWFSQATFHANAQGLVDVTSSRPIQPSSYEDTDRMGLFWSMLPVSGDTSASFKCKDDAVSVEIKLYIADKLVAQETVIRYIRAADVQRIDVREGNLVGTLFIPPSKHALPVIITLGGSEGGLGENRAKLIASNGFAVLALGYFGVNGLPSELEEIPLEYFETAFAFLKTQPGIDASRIGLYGASRGAELSLILGSFFPEQIAAIVAVAPSSVVYGGLSEKPVNAWIYKGNPIAPYAPVPNTDFTNRKEVTAENPVHTGDDFLQGMQDIPAFESAAIPVEKIQCPILLISGGDDQMWPSEIYANQILDRLKKKNSDVQAVHLNYPNAGHCISIPHLPTRGPTYYHPVDKLWFTIGGSREEDAKASRESWSRLMEFFHESLEIKNEKESIMNIQNLLQEYLEDNRTPGAAVALIDHGKIQFFCSGNMAIDGNPVTEDTIFEIGSITKVFTTLALVDMMNKGKVQLDDPIEKYLPGVKIPELDGKKITLRHLATHTSGMPRLPENFDLEDRSNPYANYSLENLYEFLNQHVLQRAPGAQFEYSNVGMGLLGHILPLVANKSYEELIFDTISSKLAMENTGIIVTPQMQKRFAEGHQSDQKVKHWDFQQSMVGCGSLRSSIKDMSQFLAANMGLLSSPISNLLRQCQEQQYEPIPQMGVGLGWMLNQCDTDTKIIWHNGGTGGFRSYLGFDPIRQKGVVILANSGGDWPDEFGSVLLDPTYQKPSIDKSLAKDSDYLNKFVGSYHATVFVTPDQPNQSLKIGVYGTRLYTELTCGEIGMLYPEKFGVFGVQGFPDGKIHFDFDENGNVTKVQAILLSNGTVIWEAIPKPQE